VYLIKDQSVLLTDPYKLVICRPYCSQWLVAWLSG